MILVLGQIDHDEVELYVPETNGPTLNAQWS